jgi:hypothetical protein
MVPVMPGIVPNSKAWRVTETGVERCYIVRPTSDDWVLLGNGREVPASSLFPTRAEATTAFRAPPPPPKPEPLAKYLAPATPRERAARTRR